MKSAGLTRYALVIESFLWYGYLVLLLGVSFFSVRYESDAWLKFGAVFYTFCVIYLIALLAGANFNQSAISAARIPILLSLLMLAWLAVQFLVPISNDFYHQIFNSSTTPEWFKHDGRISIEPQTTRMVFLSQAFIFFWLLITLSFITNRRRINELIITIMLIGLMHALIGIYAKLDNLILVDRQALDGHFNVARGLFVNRNHYASFICITLIGAITYFIKSLMHEWRQQRLLLAILDVVLSPKLFYFSAIVIGVIALLFSQSRAALFGFLFAFFSIVLVFITFDKRVINKGRVLPLLCISIVVIGYFFGQELVQRLSVQGVSIGERIDQWKITWVAIQNSPLFGYGAGSYSTVFQIYREHDALRQVVFDQSHNEYLHLWLEQGAIGLGLFICFIAVLFYKTIKAYQVRYSTLVNALAISGVVVIISVLTQALVDFNLQILNIRCFFFVIIGLMFASISLQKEN